MSSALEYLYYADRPDSKYNCYNGNIGTMKWSNSNYEQIRGYKFVYDNANRLTDAIYGERTNLNNKENRYNEVLEYDENGNITSLQRRGLKQDGQYGKIDNLNLSYIGNQLSSVEEDAKDYDYAGSFEYKRAKGTKYMYNENGSLVADKSRKIAYIEYDLNNNPVRIQFTNANVTKYVYSATGEKLRVIYQTSVYPEDADIVKIGKTKELTPEEINCTETVDYLLGGSLVMKNDKIDKVLFDGGYAQASAVSNTTKDKFAFNFYNQDHLGNNREVVDAKGNVTQVTNYYPFGAPYADATAIKGAAVQPYKYNGKELDLMHGLNTYDYGARQYNPVTARWDRMDPLSEKYYNVSPYVYCMNNPVRFIDPDGQKPTKKEAAMIADDVYNATSGTLSGGWRRVATKSGAILNDEKSGLKSAVYGRWDAKQKKYTEFVYATAGTDFTSMEDWSNNIDQLSGESKQYEQSINNAKLLNGYFKNSELTFVGHSLGGGLASANSLATGRDAITFNAAGLSDETKTKHNLIKTSGRIDAYVVKGEALSNAQGQIGLKAEGNIHTIKVPIYIEVTAKATTSTDIALSLWKHTMGCVKYIFK